MDHVGRPGDAHRGGGAGGAGTICGSTSPTGGRHADTRRCGSPVRRPYSTAGETGPLQRGNRSPVQLSREVSENRRRPPRRRPGIRSHGHPAVGAARHAAALPAEPSPAPRRPLATLPGGPPSAPAATPCLRASARAGVAATRPGKRSDRVQALRCRPSRRRPARGRPRRAACRPAIPLRTGHPIPSRAPSAGARPAPPPALRNEWLTKPRGTLMFTACKALPDAPYGTLGRGGTVPEALFLCKITA